VQDPGLSPAPPQKKNYSTYSVVEDTEEKQTKKDNFKLGAVILATWVAENGRIEASWGKKFERPPSQHKKTEHVGVGYLGKCKIGGSRSRPAWTERRSYLKKG
jgi:hypothetical protein